MYSLVCSASNVLCVTHFSFVLSSSKASALCLFLLLVRATLVSRLVDWLHAYCCLILFGGSGMRLLSSCDV